MEVERGKIYAVITGDIVGSSKLKPAERKQLHVALKDTSDKLMEHFKQWVPVQVDIFRGDSWQLLVIDPAQSLRIGLFFRSFLRGKMESKRVDTRISIGVGSIEFMPEEGISSGDGEAFRSSGEALESLSRTHRMTISVPQSLISNNHQALDVILKLIDALAQDWTDKQAHAVSGALLEYTQEKIARTWFEREISQQAVAQHLDRAGWNAIEIGLNYFAHSLSGITDTSVRTGYYNL